MKIQLLRMVLILLLLMMFGTIFNFSNQEGVKSASLSRRVTVFVTKNIKSIQRLEASEKEKVLAKIEHIIRKMAHYTLYNIVGFLMMSLMSTYNLENIKRIGISFIVGVIYASTDEIHQSFIPGRGPGIGDVFIDSMGVITGIIIVLGMIYVTNKIREKINIKIWRKK